MNPCIAVKFVMLKNRWRAENSVSRDIALSLAAILLILLFYITAYKILYAVKHVDNNAGVALQTVLALGFSLVSALIVCSACAITIGTMFLSAELQTLRAAPLSPINFFTAKVVDITLGSIWTIAIFGLPIVLACADVYNQLALFIVHTTLSLLPTVMIPIFLSMTSVILILALFPAKSVRPLLGVTAIIAIIGMIRGFQSMSAHGVYDLNALISLLSVFKINDHSWLPSNWSANYLTSVLVGNPDYTILYKIHAVAAASLATAYITYRLFYERAYEQCQLLNSHDKIFRYSIINIITSPLPDRFAAYINKDIRQFMRDPAQSAQLLLILGLCLLYIYNFRALSVIDSFPEIVKVWWQSVVVIGNIAAASFVASAIATRFVYTTISLEGRSFEMLKSMPISFNEYLRAKFWEWYIPICAATMILVSSGAMAVNAPLSIILVSCVLAAINCYGIVALALYFGSKHANFHWENPSQLSASFGGLLFMVCSLLLVAADALPGVLLLALWDLKLKGFYLPEANLYLCISLCFLFPIYLNMALNYKKLKQASKILDSSLG